MLVLIFQVMWSIRSPTEERITLYTPAQVMPFPLNPMLQLQVRLPSILKHSAFASHPPLLARHSLISWKQTRSWWIVYNFNWFIHIDLLPTAGKQFQVNVMVTCVFVIEVFSMEDWWYLCLSISTLQFGTRLYKLTLALLVAIVSWLFWLLMSMKMIDGFFYNKTNDDDELKMMMNTLSGTKVSKSLVWWIAKQASQFQGNASCCKGHLCMKQNRHSEYSTCSISACDTK